MQQKRMELVRAIAAGSTGTTAMTAFSYVLSDVKDKNFKEPLLLAAMIKRLIPSLNKNSSERAGWVTHYAVGVLFAILYKDLLRKRRLNATVKNGSIAGGLTGLAAIAIWHSTFRLHPNPPHTHRRKFYGQLVVAHIIFGIVTVLLLNDKNRTEPKARSINQPALKYLEDDVLY